MADRKALADLCYSKPYKLYLGVFDDNDEFVGWHMGFQESDQTFYMCNSGILPHCQRKGLYTALLNVVLDVVTRKGFQIIYGRHTATNNAVIIPKLKAGFIISSLEIDDRFGTLVQLRYYTNPTRRKLMDFRVGQQQLDTELKELFKDTPS